MSVVNEQAAFQQTQYTVNPETLEPESPPGMCVFAESE